MTGSSTAAGRGRHHEVTAARTAVHHPRIRQLLFDLARRASSNAARIPGPAVDLVDSAASHLEAILAQPDRPASAPPKPLSERHVA